MRVLEQRNAIQRALFFIRWQLWTVALALPAHLAFVVRGLGNPGSNAWSRFILAAKLVRIHLRVPCAHAPLELLSIVEEIIQLPETIPGVVVECGTYQGGSTAKLSHAVALSKRKLIVCDSFEGLPDVGREDHVELKEHFQKGDFASRLEQVRLNLRRYGNIKAVEFVPGWYRESLTRLEGSRIACLFLDVDLQESIKTCLVALWKLMEPGCKVFVHDVDRPSVVEPFRNQNWWAKEIGSELPRFVGDGKGLSWQRRLLGYAIKP